MSRKRDYMADKNRQRARARNHRREPIQGDHLDDLVREAAEAMAAGQRWNLPSGLAERDKKPLWARAFQLRDQILTERGTPPHPCGWPGCGISVVGDLWGCSTHWFRLPEEARELLGATFRGRDSDPDAHFRALERTEAWCRKVIAREKGAA